MRKISKFLPIMAAAAFLMSGCSGQNSSSSSSVTPKVVTKFEFVKKLDTINYYENDQINAVSPSLGSLVPTFKATYEDGTSEQLNYGAQDLIFSGFDSSKLGVQEITVSYRNKELKYNATVFGKDDVIIDVQPKVVDTEAPNGVDLSVSVRDESKVKSYQWQILNSYDSEHNPVYRNMDGTTAKTNKFEIKSTEVSPTFHYFRCEITSLKDAKFYSEDGGYNITNPDADVAGAFLGDYAIIPGQTLDLSKTPYGSGTISLSTDKTKYTFKDVDFSNDYYETGVYLTHVVLEITNWGNTIEDIYFNFEGANVFNNKYWEEATGQGGFTFALNFLGAGAVLPTVHMGGTGTLTSKGGTGMFYGNVAVEIDGLPIVIQTPESQRFDKGIVCRNLVMKNGASIQATLGNEVIFIERGATDPFDNAVEIGEGCSVFANINAGKVIGDTTLIHGIFAANYVDIYKANIQINTVVDIDFFEETMQACAVDCIGANSTGVNITNSTVLCSVTNTATESSFIPVQEVSAITGQYVSIANSEVNVAIQGKNMMVCDGIYSKNLLIAENSSVYVDVSCSGCAEGVVGFDRADISASTLEVTVDCDEIPLYPYNVTGIRSKEFASLKPGNMGYIKVLVNAGFTIGVPFGSETTEKPVVDPMYVPSHIPTDSFVVSTPSAYSINQTSYISKYIYDEETGTAVIKYLPVETFYDASGESVVKSLELYPKAS